MCHCCRSSSPGLFPYKRESRFIPAQAGTQRTQPLLLSGFPLSWHSHAKQPGFLWVPARTPQPPCMSFPRKRESGCFFLGSCLRRNDTLPPHPSSHGASPCTTRNSIFPKKPLDSQHSISPGGAFGTAGLSTARREAIGFMRIKCYPKKNSLPEFVFKSLRKSKGLQKISYCISLSDK